MIERIKEILTQIRPEFNFDESDDFIGDGYLDSFDITVLITEFETFFGVLIDGMDVKPEYFSSYEAMERLVEKSEKK